MASAIMGVLKYLPASVARKALTKVNPNFEGFFSKALSYGIDANRAIDYLSDRFTSEAQKDHERQLERGSVNNTLRPDEKVSRSEMSNASIPGKILKGAASLAIGGGLGMGGNKSAPQPQQMAQEPIEPQEMQRQEALQKFNKKVRPKKPKSELNPQALKEQFQQEYGEQPEQSQGDDVDQALLAAFEKILSM